MAVPVSLAINCDNEELQRQLNDDLSEYLPRLSISESNAKCQSQAQQPTDVADDSVSDSYSDSEEGTNFSSLLLSPVVDGRIRKCVTTPTEVCTPEISASNVDISSTPPTSPYCFDTEDPLLCLSSPPRSSCKKNCLVPFHAVQVHDHRLNMMEMDKDCKDMLLMGQLQACGTSKGDKGCVSSSSETPAKRQKYSYQFNNTSVCKSCFMYINCVGEKYLRNLRKHVREHGPVPRHHGNNNRKPNHAIKYEDARRVVQFLEGYSGIHGMPQPAARRGRDDTPTPIYLPKFCTYDSVHKEYGASCQEMGARLLSETSFRRIWHQCVPHITFMPSGTDVCPKCEEFRDRVRTSFNTEEERVQINAELTHHLQQARTEREHYTESCQKATAELKDHPKTNVRNPCSENLFQVHYTFDFANSVLIPSHVRQEGPLYYKSPLKCNWFGVCNDGRTKQTKYIYTEDCCIGLDGAEAHSSNAVVSLIDDFFSNHSECEKVCYLNADNCGGQNKNQIMTGYLSWRVMTGQHQEINLHFMKPYHARCLVDGMFGLGRQSIRRRDIDCVADVKTAIEKSSACAEVVDIPQSWVWRDWKAFLKPVFKPVPSIQKYQHFRFSASHPGSVFVKESVGSVEKEAKILKKGKSVQKGMLPPRLEASGLSSTRSWYLYKHIRPYVHHPHKDTTCPKPFVAETIDREQ